MRRFIDFMHQLTQVHNTYHKLSLMLTIILETKIIAGWPVRVVGLQHK
jgi:hypothetical protein